MHLSQVHQPSKKNLPRNPLAESRLPQIARIFTDSFGALISQLIKRIPAACKKQRINRIKRMLFSGGALVSSAPTKQEVYQNLVTATW